MKTSEFDYKLPKELIANEHAKPRDSSRLFLYNRANGKIEHKHFHDIVDHLDANDILVFNDTKVFKARIFGVKETGGRREFLFVRPDGDFLWEVMIKRKVKIGDKVLFGKKLECEILKRLDERLWQVRLNKNVEKVFKYLEKEGEVPLPPYVGRNQKSKIKNQKFGATSSQLNKDFYQTVYADKIGSVAAPTAGFHFTPSLIKKIEKKGVKILKITLHVGPGTFLPVETENISEHKMHEEFFEVKKEVWNEIVNASAQGGSSKKRIVAVGTTTTRVLETLGANLCRLDADERRQKVSVSQRKSQRESAYIGSTDIFIYPPYEFKIVDALITNFHLPKSTLLMLVAAFLAPGKIGGVEIAKKLYNEAVEEKYRFYSFGDSMMIK